MRQFKILGATLLFLNLLSASLAQGNPAEAQRLAGVLANQAEFPVNVRLRYQVLQDLIPSLKGKGDSSPTLTFFSTTRVLSWNRPVGPEATNNLRALESQMVALAKGKGVNLDLPPVGYSSSGAPVSVAANPGQSILPPRSDRETLAQATLRAEEFGTDALNRKPTPELVALRDRLTALRLDLADSTVASDTVREVLRTRVEFLISPAASSVDSGFIEHLDRLTDLLRSTFPPDQLRQSRGQSVTI